MLEFPLFPHPQPPAAKSRYSSETQQTAIHSEWHPHAPQHAARLWVWGPQENRMGKKIMRFHCDHVFEKVHTPFVLWKRRVVLMGCRAHANTPYTKGGSVNLG